MKHLNFLSKSSSRSCGHRVTTLASTVGSQEEFYVSGGNSRGAFTPADVCQTSSVRLNRFTAHRRGIMLKPLFLAVLFLFSFGVGNAWATSQTWEKVTTAPSDWSGEYLIVNESANKAFDGSITTGSDFNGHSGQSVTISNSKITLDDQYSLTLTAITGGYKLQSASGFYIGKNANSNGVDANKTYSANYKVTISFNSSTKVVSIAGNGGRTIGYVNSLFKFYASSNANVCLYKKVESSCSVKPTVGANLTSVNATTNSITATVPISAIGGCNITENGLVYSTSNSTPTVGGTSCTKVTTTACGSTAANKTVTITGLDCGTTYYVRGYAINGAGTQYTTNTTTQATSDCPIYTVTLKDDNSTLPQASYGASVILPSRSGCTGYTFAGWSTTNNTSWTTAAPTIINAGSYTPTANIELYPVYTKTEAGSGADTYQRVSSTAAVTDGQYLIVCEGQSKAFDGGASNLDATPNFISVTISSNTITASETTTAAEFTIGTSGDNRTITSATGYTIGRTGTTNGFESSNTSTLTNTITISSNNAIITSSGGPKLQYLNSGNNSKFRYYASNQTAIQLYKRISSSVTSYISVPNCCTSLASINGSFFWTTHFCPAWPAKHRS